MLCQYRDDGRQESTFIFLSGFVGNHLKIVCDSLSMYIRLLINFFRLLYG